MERDTDMVVNFTKLKDYLEANELNRVTVEVLSVVRRASHKAKFEVQFAYDAGHSRWLTPVFYGNDVDTLFEAGLEQYKKDTDGQG